MEVLKTVAFKGQGEAKSQQLRERSTGRQSHAKSREFKRGINPIIQSLIEWEDLTWRL